MTINKLQTFGILYIIRQKSGGMKMNMMKNIGNTPMIKINYKYKEKNKK